MLETFANGLASSYSIAERHKVIVGAIDEILGEYEGCLLMKQVSDILNPYFLMDQKKLQQSLTILIRRYEGGPSLKSLRTAVEETFPDKEIEFEPFPEGVRDMSLLIYREDSRLTQYVCEHSEVDGNNIKVCVGQHVFA